MGDVWSELIEMSIEKKKQVKLYEKIKKNKKRKNKEKKIIWKKLSKPKNLN